MVVLTRLSCGSFWICNLNWLVQHDCLESFDLVVLRMIMLVLQECFKLVSLGSLLVHPGFALFVSLTCPAHHSLVDHPGFPRWLSWPCPLLYHPGFALFASLTCPAHHFLLDHPGFPRWFSWADHLVDHPGFAILVCFTCQTHILDYLGFPSLTSWILIKDQLWSWMKIRKMKDQSDSGIQSTLGFAPDTKNLPISYRLVPILLAWLATLILNATFALQKMNFHGTFYHILRTNWWCHHK